jgi:putative tryptophan/tyrosine transport system substrate-binding protein
MRRRELIGAIAAGLGWPRVAAAQPAARLRRVGVLAPYPRTDVETQAHHAVLRKALSEHGWRQGENVVIDTRGADGDVGRLAAVAGELAATQPDVVLMRSTAGTRALLARTRTIPIVFVVVSDPVGDGFVRSMARPDSNVTGFTNVEASVAGKWLEMLRELKPGLSRVALVFGRRTAPGGGEHYLRLVQAAADALAVAVVPVPIENGDDVERQLEAFGREPGGIVVLPDATTSSYRSFIVAAASRARLPAIYPFRNFVSDGGLISYGIDISDIYRRAASYVDRILRGASPSDLPVQAPTKFELTVNARTAQALGLTLPPVLLARADEVIE